MKVNLTDFWGNRLEELYEEYKLEERNKYHQMMHDYIPYETLLGLKDNTFTKYHFSTYEIYPHNWVNGISIFVSRHHTIETLFQSIVPLNDFAEEIQGQQIVRDFTKFCFFLQGTIQPI